MFQIVPPVSSAPMTAAPAATLAIDSDFPAPAKRTLFGDLRDIFKDFANSRDLIVQLTLRDIKIRYKQAAFGFAWALLLPIAIICAGLAVRVAISVASGRNIEIHQLAGMAIKSVPWAFFVGCIGTATPSLTGNMTLVTKVYFPREVLPLSACLAQTFDSLIGTVVVSVILLFFHVTLSIQHLWLLLLLPMLWMFTAATAIFLSCANLFFRDVKYLVQVFLSFGIFFTPVLVDAAMFGKKGAPIIMMNPLSPILEGLRLSVIEHHNLLEPLLAPKGFVVWHPWYLGYSAAWAVFGLLGALLLFHRSEKRFALFV
jgi:lipopolysaccharide transport system permease protein